MTTRVVLVPALYYRNWDTSANPAGNRQGELWLVLCPHVECGVVTPTQPLGDELTGFYSWALNPHFSGTPGNWNFSYERPDRLNLNTVRCGPANNVLSPINLPSDVDVEVTIGRGSAFESQSHMRSRDARMRPSGANAAGASTPFAYGFNEDFRARLHAVRQSGGRQDELMTIYQFLSAFDAGKRVSFSTNTRDASFMERPFDGYWPKLTGERDVSTVSLHWALGLMFRLGTQERLSELKAIDSVEILLSANGQEISTLFFPDLNRGMDVSSEYFGAIGDGFKRTLSASVEDRYAVTYVNPGFRSLHPPVRDGVWSLERSSGTSSLPSEYVAPRNSNLAQVGPLSLLAGIEARAAIKAANNDLQKIPLSNDPIGTELYFKPGLQIRGSFEPYRKYPAPLVSKVAPGLIPTLMAFVPDKESAELVKALSPHTAQLTTSLCFEEGGWRMEFLHAGRLPWDGPDIVWKFLATPAGAPAVEGKPRTRLGFSCALFVPVLANDRALKARPVGDTNGQAAGSRHIWAPSAAVGSSATALASFWAGLAPTWPVGLPINAVQVSGIDMGADAGVTVVFLDQFTFEQAESVVRLEKVLTVRASKDTPTEPTDQSGAMTPAQDFEDDLVNFNTAIVLTQTSVELDPELLRRPAAVTFQQAIHADAPICRDGNLNREQRIPLTHGWPRDPLDPLDGSPESTRYLSGVGWQAIRRSVSDRYGFTQDADGFAFNVKIEHSFGDRLRLGQGTQDLRIDRSQRLDWPVELATEPDERAVANKDINARTDEQGGFFRCRYELDESSGKDLLVVTVNEALLLGPDAVNRAVADKEELRRRYATAMTAWRAVAELAIRADLPEAEQSVVTLELEIANFDLEKGLWKHASSLGLQGATEPLARALAVAQIQDAWSKSIATSAPVVLPQSSVVKLRTWATELITGVRAPSSGPPVQFTMPVLHATPVGRLAHLARARLTVRRSEKLAPAPLARQILLPSSQKPGVFRVTANTLQRAWADRGFGPDAQPLVGADIALVGHSLVAAHQAWFNERLQRCDSIDVDVTQTPASRKLSDEDKRVVGALMSSLPGSDWFAPAGKGPLDVSARAVQPVLVPLGFAPCRPHKAMGAASQKAMEMFARAIQDVADAAYPSWTSRSKNQWIQHFERLDKLVAYDASREEWAGRIGIWSELLTGRLLYPQPDAGAEENDVRVRELIDAARRGKGHLAMLLRQMRGKLMANPGMFLDSKAMLLTAMRFVKIDGAPAPHPTTLARTRFARKTKGAQGEDKLVAQTLTISDLSLVDPAGGAEFSVAIGYLEQLDTARYGNQFDIPSPPDADSACIAESFEHVVDPDASANTGTWPTLAPVLPLARANSGGHRTVHLASRRPVAAPVLRWSGENRSLEQKLRATDAGTRKWRLGELSGGTATANDLDAKMISRRTVKGLVGRPKADTGIMFVLYAIQGDDENLSSALRSLANDGFFLSLKETTGQGISFQPLEAPAELSEISERALRKLADSAPGSAEAESAITAMLFASDLNDAQFRLDLANVIQLQKSELPGEDSLLLRTDRSDPSKLAASQTTGLGRRLLDAALFEQELEPVADIASAAPKNLFLLLAFESQVWDPMSCSFSHGRNLPYSRWFNDGSENPFFAPEFWMYANQAAAPARLVLMRSAANQSRHWRAGDGRVVKLGVEWRNEQRVADLLMRLLRAPGVVIGDSQETYGGKEPILSDAAADKWFQQELSITVFHEQFEDDPASADPVGRVPIHSSNNLEKPNYKESSEVWFKDGYDHFSVDFQWFGRSGTSLLRLERIFVLFE